MTWPDHLAASMRVTLDEQVKRGRRGGQIRPTEHFLETADHSFKILKRSRSSTEDVYAEAARITASWVASLE